MKIVIDDKIPYIREAIKRLGCEAVYKNGSGIGSDDVRGADALIVRTRTRCDGRLLDGSGVKFVATATIGFDHIDAAYMRRAGIEWMSCPGCNAASVAQYVRSVLLLLKRDRGARLGGMTIGIVGCGHVGSKVKAVAEEYGMRTLVCDPPRQERGDGGPFVAMDSIEREDELLAFEQRLEDRFGTLPDQARQLMQVVRLRWMAVRYGIERLVLKNERMTAFLVTNPSSPFYRSDEFGALLRYATQNPYRCKLREQDGRRSIIFSNIPTIEEAYEVFLKIESR